MMNFFILSHYYIFNICFLNARRKRASENFSYSRNKNMDKT